LQELRHRTQPEFAAYMTNLGDLPASAVMQGTIRSSRGRPRWHCVRFQGRVHLPVRTPHWLAAFDRKLPRLHLERILRGEQKWKATGSDGRPVRDYLRDQLPLAQDHYRAHFDGRWWRLAQAHLAGTHNYMWSNKVLTTELIYRRCWIAPQRPGSGNRSGFLSVVSLASHPTLIRA